MSVASRQTTCAACGGPLGSDADLEFLIDDAVRMVAVHPGHSTQPDRARHDDAGHDDAGHDDAGHDDPDRLWGAAA